MSTPARRSRPIFRVTAFVGCVAVAFYLFFALGKVPPFRDVNPFGGDPYDIFGSLGFQIALLTAVITYARALRLRHSPAHQTNARLILRGNIVVLSAILISLIADTIAACLSPVSASYSAAVLLWALVLMLVLACSGIAAVTAVFREIRTVPPPRDLTPADGLEDLRHMAHYYLAKAAALLPRRFLARLEHFRIYHLFARLPWLCPRTHPWRFACALGALAGTGLSVAHLQEGLPPDLPTGLLITSVFIGFEFAATILGFVLLGGYLGLRPSLHLNKRGNLAAVFSLSILAGCGMQPANPLISAARSGDAQAVANLLAHGADPNQRWGVNGWTPLLHAIHKNQRTSVEALLAGGADPNARGSHGMTALMMAAGYGDAEIVQVLLSKGADPYAETAEGDNALVMAVGGVPDIDKFTVGKCQAQTVAVLLKKAPDLVLKDTLHGRAARLAARSGGCTDVLALIDRSSSGAQSNRGQV